MHVRHERQQAQISLIVFDDADATFAANETVKAKFRNNGQTCVCPNRIYIQEGIYEEFMEKLVNETKALLVGDPLDPKSDMSPILHPSSLKKTEEHLEDALSKGAEIIWKGKDLYHPTIVAGASPEMLLYTEETFGPIAAVTKFSTDEEGFRMANDTVYGLASYVFTKSLSRMENAISQLEYGIIGVNDGVPSTYQASFGGVKQSGFGREGGPNGLRDYLIEKFISRRC